LTEPRSKEIEVKTREGKDMDGMIHTREREREREREGGRVKGLKLGFSRRGMCV
jgi:hypothetical protein